MSGSDILCNNVAYLAKKRKIITEMNLLKNKVLEQQCMTIEEVGRQYLIEKGLQGNPVQSKTYWTDAIQKATSNRSWFATIMDCYTELFDLLSESKRCAMSASSGTLVPETRDALVEEFQSIKADINALLSRRVFEDRVTMRGTLPDNTGVERNVNMNGQNISNAGNVTADSFVKSDGTPNQYLMADGSTVTVSGGGQSNTYLYTTDLSNTTVASSGKLIMNNSNNQLVTSVLISHTTRDTADIYQFLKLITKLSVLHIQEQNNSANYVKYTVSGVSSVSGANGYSTVTVAYSDGGGDGMSNFAIGADIFMSIFTDTPEIENRITEVESKIAKLSSNGIDSTFSSTLAAGSFVKSGGTQNQYLMADGSTTTISGGGQSNIYLYTTVLSNTATPMSTKKLIMNNTANNSVNTIHISNLTRDDVNIYQFLKLITRLSIVYIQEQNNSANYVKYRVSNVSSTSDTSTNGYSTLTVAHYEGGGIGNGVEIFMSIFADSPEIDTRIIEVESKTTNLSSSGTDSTFSSKLTAGSFVKSGGTPNQYLMANGSSLEYSANSGNSNYYLYKSRKVIRTPPNDVGYITYKYATQNDATQNNATTIYISSNTKDGVNIEVFFKTLSSLNEVYLQSQNNSANYIQYNITGKPIITLGSGVAIPVTKRESGGLGGTNFTEDSEILLSFFTNNIEADTRISEVESKTSQLSALTGGISVTGYIDMGANKITTTYTPQNSGDLVNKNYVDETFVKIPPIPPVAPEFSNPSTFYSVLTIPTAQSDPNHVGNGLYKANNGNPLQARFYRVTALREHTHSLNTIYERTAIMNIYAYYVHYGPVRMVILKISQFRGYLGVPVADANILKSATAVFAGLSPTIIPSATVSFSMRFAKYHPDSGMIDTKAAGAGSYRIPLGLYITNEGFIELVAPNLDAFSYGHLIGTDGETTLSYLVSDA